jgi:ABC-type lipoprotein export system ATPase subunit
MNVQLTHLKCFIPGTNDKLFQIKSLTVPKHSKVLIQGPSGCGKTTLLHVIAGLFEPTEGSVLIEGNDLKKLSEKELSHLRRDSFGIVFQKLNLLDHLTAEENVELILNSKNQKAAESALQKVNLHHKKLDRAGFLSLGEQQRVAVARVIAKESSIILADEPTSSLDEKNASEVIDLLLSLPNRPTTIVVSHDSRIRNRFDKVLDWKDVVNESL